QIQKMPCHQTPHHGIVLVDRVNRGRLFFVAYDNKRDLESDLLHFLLKIRVGITGIYDPLGMYGAYHTEIFLLQMSVSLGVADKHTVSLLVCHRFDPLEQKNIIRTGKSGTENHDQFLFPVFFSVSSFRKFIAQFPGCAFHFFHCLGGKRNIAPPVQDHRDCRLGYSRFFRHLGRCYFLFRHPSFPFYSSTRPSSARSRVTSSIYSRSPPTGTPLAIRLTLIPVGLISLLRYIAVVSPSRLE